MKKKLTHALVVLISIFLGSMQQNLQAETHSERVEKTLKFVRSHNVLCGHFIFFDAFGKMKELIFPLHYLEKVLNTGVFFDGSSVPGYSEINQSDLCLKADLDAMYVSPWKTQEGSSVYLFTYIYDIDGTPYKNDPRSVLKKVVDRAQKAGYECVCGIELEFFLFKQDKETETLFPCDDQQYCDPATTTNMNAFKEMLLFACTHMGLNPEKIHHEVAPGQYELVLGYTDPITMADRVHLAKHLIKTFAQQNGLIATFMPKPIAGINGSGMHNHISLKKNGLNAFYDKNGKAFLSHEAQCFISGVLKIVPEINLLFNQEINSSKRLIPGFEAPVYICCGEKNRSAAIRIPEVIQSNLEENHGAAVRIELRWPDAECNPYLAFSAIFQAGLDGIENNETPVTLVTENLYHLDPAVLAERNIKTLPSSLQEAINNFKQSEFARVLLGDSLHAHYVTTKQAEWNDYMNTEKHNPLVITYWEKNRGISLSTE